jgi:hypothetical protein
VAERITGLDVHRLRAKVAKLQEIEGGSTATTAKHLFTGLLLQIYADKKLDRQAAKPEDIMDDYVLSWNATSLYKSLSKFMNPLIKPGE